MNGPNDARHTKRARATKEQMTRRHDALTELVQSEVPTSVRHVFYRAVVAGLVEKTDNGYAKVQRALVELRVAGRIPYDHIVDGTRWMRKPVTWASVDDALADLTSGYRRAMWQDLDTVVEVWCESESVAGVLRPVIDEYDVPCYPIKGQTSDSFCHSVAVEYAAADYDVMLLYVGDFDPAGLEIESQLNDKLRRFSGRDDLQLERIGVTPQQAAGLQRLGTVPKKSSWRAADGRRHEFPGMAVEAEAIEAAEMRRLVAARIDAVIPDHVRRAHEVFEAQEREFLRTLPTLRGVS